MKKLAMAAVVVAVTTVLAGAIALAATGDNEGSRGPDDETRTLRFDVVFSPFNFLDLGEQGPTVGDETLFNDILKRNGKRAGKQAGFCKLTAITAEGFDVECMQTISLPAGQITAQGLTTNAPVKVIAVTGGTGSFVGAEGIVRLVEFGNGRGSLTVRLED